MLPREREQVWDHHFFIGLFRLPHEHNLTMVPVDAWKQPKPQTEKHGGLDYIPNWYTAKDFAGDEGSERNGGYLLREGSTAAKTYQFNNLPLPLVCEDDKSTVYTFQPSFKSLWKAPMKTREWGSDVRSLSMRRVNLEAVKEWIQLPSHLQRNSSNGDKISGLWYLTDVKEFLEFFCTNRQEQVWQVFHLTSKYWAMEVRTRQIAPATSAPLLQKDSVARLLQNTMTELETVLLGALRTNAGWGVDILSWKLGTYAAVKHENVKDKNGILTAIKKALRDTPDMLRKRSAQSPVHSWEEYNQGNNTLRSAIYQKLEAGLPRLPDEVNRYLDEFQVPNAKLFFRIVRCHSILALRELARQVAVGRVDISPHLKDLDTCVQSEVNMIFDRVRENLDVYVDKARVKEVADTAAEVKTAGGDWTRSHVLLAMAAEFDFKDGARFTAIGEAMRGLPGVELDEAFFEVYDMFYYSAADTD